MTTIVPWLTNQFFDDNGNPLAGGKIYTYAAGTSTPLATYTDSTGGTPNANPIILNSRGEANIWIGTDPYKFEIKDSTDVLIRTVDNVSASASTASQISFTPSGSIVATDVQAAIQELDTEKQPLDADLTAIAGLSTAADKLPYFTGPGAAALTTLTSYARTLLDDADVGTALATLGNGSKQTVWVPAGAFTARTTNGAAPVTAETTTNKVMLKTYNFDATTPEYIQFTIRMPKGWDEGTMTAYFLWSNGSGSGDVVWGIQAVGISNDDVLDSAFGTAQTVTDSVTAAGDLMQSAETAAITAGGSPVEGDLVVFQVYRDAGNIGDTLAVDARLHGVVIIYTTASLTDA